MADFVQLIRDQYTSIPDPTLNFSGQVFIVTGSNTGLGFCTAENFVKNGAAKVYLAVRTISKGEKAKERIEESTGRKGVVSVLQVDMANKQSILDFVQEVNKLERVDGIIENAAVALDSYTVTNGIETSLYTNVVGTMLLTKEMVPVLQKSGGKYKITPFISIVGSEMAVFDVSTAGTKEFKENKNDDVFDILGDKNMSNRYGVTKTLLLWAFRQFIAENPLEKTGVYINYTNPGLCWSELGRDGSVIGRIFLTVFRTLLARSTEAGGHILVLSAIAGEKTHGKYITNAVVHEDRITDYIKDDEGLVLQKRVWADTQKRF